MSVIDRMKKVLGEAVPKIEQEAAAEGSETEMEIAKYLALAASAMGVELDDTAAVDEFIASAKLVVTKDKAKLKSLLRRFTATKAKIAAKGTVKAVS